jgi:hypothetical protein
MGACSAFLVGGDEVDGCGLLVGGGVEGGAGERVDCLLVESGDEGFSLASSGVSDTPRSCLRRASDL